MCAKPDHDKIISRLKLPDRNSLSTFPEYSRKKNTFCWSAPCHQGQIGSTKRLFIFFAFETSVKLQVGVWVRGEGGGGGEGTLTQAPGCLCPPRAAELGLCKQSSSCATRLVAASCRSSCSHKPRHPSLDREEQQRADKTTRTLGARRLDRASSSCRLQPTRHV